MVANVFDIRKIHNKICERRIKDLRSYASKPVIIDYPQERTLLKREFKLLTERQGFSESVAMAMEVLQVKQKSTKFNSEIEVSYAR